MNPDLGTELRSGRIISSSLETPVPTDPDMAQSSANDSDSNETSDISSQLSEIKESYERKINELQNEFSQLKDLMMAVISKTDTENRQSTSKAPSKPTHTVGLDSHTFCNVFPVIYYILKIKFVLIDPCLKQFNEKQQWRMNNLCYWP